MPTGKRIGFVDYKLENFHANVYLKAFRTNFKDRGYTVTGAFSTDQDNGRAWCQKNDVPFYATPDDLNAHVDAYVILAPSNPETHLDLANRFFPFGKITYVDKTFAPDLPTAKKIFELADQHSLAMQTTSALRYTDVQRVANELRHAEAERSGTPRSAASDTTTLQHMVAWGSGGSFHEYAIHPVELVVSCMGPRATHLMRRGAGDQSQLLLNFEGGRTAVVNVYANTETPFAASLTTRKLTKYVEVNGATLFTNMAAALCDFFDAGKPTIDRTESLAVRKILDAAATPEALRSFIPLPD